MQGVGQYCSCTDRRKCADVGTCVCVRVERYRYRYRVLVLRARREVSTHHLQSCLELRALDQQILIQAHTRKAQPPRPAVGHWIHNDVAHLYACSCVCVRPCHSVSTNAVIRHGMSIREPRIAATHTYCSDTYADARDHCRCVAATHTRMRIAATHTYCSDTYDVHTDNGQAIHSHSVLNHRPVEGRARA